MKFKFEQIDNNHQRAKVIGGWLVKAYESVTHQTEDRGMLDGWDYRVAMTFVPDEGHYWKIDQEDG